MIFARRRYTRDNYVYLIAEGTDAALVDPGDAAAALDLARQHGVSPRFVLHTHGHPDHSGGSREIRDRLGATVHGHAGDAAWFVPDADLATVRDLELGALRIRVHAAPGHTPGSVLLEWRGRLLTGDTLFWGGCGNCRQGGDPGRLADTFLEVFPGLDGGLEVHPGHDYAEANLPFAIDIDPDNGPAAARLAEAREARARREEPRPTTLDEERSMNPFLRVGLPRTRDALRRRGVPFQGVRDAFVALRRLRDAW
jgi:hydroxyacylglutathione hydrolase